MRDFFIVLLFCVGTWLVLFGVYSICPALLYIFFGFVLWLMASAMVLQIVPPKIVEPLPVKPLPSIPITTPVIKWQYRSTSCDPRVGGRPLVWEDAYLEGKIMGSVQELLPNVYELCPKKWQWNAGLGLDAWTGPCGNLEEGKKLVEDFLLRGRRKF